MLGGSEMDSVELKKLVKEAIEQETSALRAEIAKMKNEQKNPFVYGI